jgi:putative transposase
MQIGNKFRCYPSPAQEQVLLQWIGRQRNIYYSKVYEDQYFRPFAQKSLQHAGQYAPIDPQYSHFKTELTPYLSEVPSVILRNGAVLWKQIVWLTLELFKFVPVANTVETTGHQLYVDIKKFPIGMLAFKAHKLPVSLHINIHAGRWHVSFNYDEGIPEPTDKAELHKMTVGLDRDVTLPLAVSDYQQFGFSKEQQKHCQHYGADMRRDVTNDQKSLSKAG